MNAEIDITGVVLKTKRLVLRPWRWEDLDDFYEYARVDGVGQMAGWNPHKSREESAEILKSFIDHRCNFAIEYNGKVIGSVGLEKYSEDYLKEFADKRCREIGYALSKDYWGQGIMPEAVSEVIRYLFEEQDLDVIFCGHFMRNTRSQRVQEKCGFTHYLYDKYTTRIGTVEDNEINILTRQMWEENRKEQCL